MLAVHGDLEIAFGTGSGRLVANGQRLDLEVDDARTLARLVGRRPLRLLAAELARAGWTLHVRSGGTVLLLAGQDARGGIVTRLLGLPRVEVNPRFPLRAAFARCRART